MPFHPSTRQLIVLHLLNLLLQLGVRTGESPCILPISSGNALFHFEILCIHSEKRKDFILDGELILLGFGFF